MADKTASSGGKGDDENRIPGPTTDRHCTDCFFLLLFMAFWVGMAIVAGFAFSNGDPRKLYLPMDVYGNICGMDNTLKTPKGWIYDFDSAVNTLSSVGAGTNCNTKKGWTIPLSDSMRESCDMRLDMTEFKYLLWVNPSEKFAYGGFCVKKCPKIEGNSTLTCPDPEVPGYNRKRGRPLITLDPTATCAESTCARQHCAYNRWSVWAIAGGTPETPVTGSVLPNVTFSDSSTPKYSYTTWDNNYNKIFSQTNKGVPKCKSIVYRCVPEFSDSGSSAVAKAADIWAQLWGDVVRAWRIFLICFFVAFILGFLWVFLMKYFAGPLVWLTLIAVLGLLIFLGIYCLQYADEEERQKPSESDSNTVKTMRALGYTFFALAFLYLCLLIYLAKRIRLAIALIHEASNAIRDMPLLVVYPIPMFVVLGGFIVWWIAVACFLMSAGIPGPRFENSSGHRDVPTSATTTWDDTLKYMMIYHFFGFLWTLGWWIAIVFMSVALAIATWYFIAPPRNNLPPTPIWSSTKTVFRYHLGTVAFGSLIIAIVQMIRAVILYFSKKVEKLTKGTKCECCVKCLLCCCNCCMAYVQRFLEFINKNAYIQTAIKGTAFCRAAKDAWKLIVNNAVRIMTVNFVADFVTFCGKIMIVVVDCIIAFRLTQEDWAIEGGDHTELNSPLLVVIVVAIIAWFVATLFMSVYECTIICMLQCFLLDEDKYGGQFCSPQLKKFCETEDVSSKKKAAATKE